MTDTTTTHLDRYEDLGWAIIPIPPGRKAPTLSGWPDLRREDHSEQAWAEMFDGQNVGVILGAPSGGLVDIDLDDDVAQPVCARLMPATLLGGRSQRPFTHLFYVCPDLPEDVRKRVFTDPVGGGVLIELRADGHQTVLPPSVHPSGDTYEWWDDIEPAEIRWGNLAPHVVLAAALSLLAKYWPEGGRHHASMHLAGALLRDAPAYWSEGARLEEAVAAVCMAAGDHEEGDRRRAARDTLEAWDHGRDTTGWRSLVRAYEAVDAGSAAQTARQWLAEIFSETEEPEAEEFEGEWGMFTARRVDLRKIITDGVPQPTPIYPGFLYENMEHLTFGEAGVGKTMLTAHVLQYLASRGENCIWLDYQNGFADIANRFVTLQADLDMLNEHIHVIDHPPANLLDANILTDLQAMVMDLDAAVVVFDSMMDVLSFARSEMNSADDFNTLHSKAIKPLRQTGRAALWFHDHAAKHDPFSSIGTSMKKNQTQAEWHIGNTISGVTRVPNRTLGGEGFIVATAGKNRSGVIGRGHKVVWDVRPHGPTTTDPDTNITTHAHTEVELRGHYPPGMSIPMPGQNISPRTSP